MNAPSERSKPSPTTVGDLQKSLVVEYFVSPRHRKSSRSDVFLSDVGVHSLVLMNESDLPENMVKYNIWLYTRPVVSHTIEVSLSLLDHNNRQCYAVEKRLVNSTSETSKVCATVDFSIIPHPPKKFFHDGLLRIQCSICVVSPLMPVEEKFNTAQGLLKKHLNMEKVGELTIKDIYTWVLPESIMDKKGAEIESDKVMYVSSDFFFLSKLKNRFDICLCRDAPNFAQQKIRVTLAVLDNMGNMRHTVEEVTCGTGKVFLKYGEVFRDRGTFFDKGKLRIYCSLQIDTSSKVSEDLTSNPSGSSETTKLTTISSPTKKATGVPTNSYAMSIGNEFATKLVAENSMFYPKVEDKSDIEEALNEILQLLKEARMETVVIVYKKTKLC